MNQISLFFYFHERRRGGGERMQRQVIFKLIPKMNEIAVFLCCLQFHNKKLRRENQISKYQTFLTLNFIHKKKCSIFNFHIFNNN